MQIHVVRNRSPSQTEVPYIPASYRPNSALTTGDMLEVLYEDNHLLVVNKPVGYATQGAAPGRPSLLDAARHYLKEKYHKPGNVYLGVVSRLDSLVSGVLVLARTSKAAARLNAQFSTGLAQKTYWALVHPGPQPAQGTWQDRLAKNEQRQRMEVVGPGRPAANATLHYATLGTHRGTAWLEIQLVTGRKHQIRVQCAHHGSPILGDVKYGSTRPFPHGIALHARSLQIEHPTRREPLPFVAPVPCCWREFGPPAEWAW